jgi:N-acyl-D-aspartate/D-glutamate deacylase
MMEYDLKITNGLIVDGTGTKGAIGDIAVKDGKVVAMGKVDGAAAQEVDATGKVVSPGFVDIHTHYDAQVLWDRDLTISPQHGVTSVVIGNCGFGVAPTKPDHRDMMKRTLEKVEGMSFDALTVGLGANWPFESFPEYMDVIEKGGVEVNVAVLAGHTPIRTFVMGDDAVKREALAPEIEQMAEIVEEAMDAGAIGFSTSHAGTHHGYGGNPVPSRLANFDEIDTLVGAMKKSGRGIMQATIGRSLFHDQFADLAEKHDVPVTWTALLAGLSGPGSHRGHLEKTAAQVARGLTIVPQVSCRPLMFDFEFNEPFPFEMHPIFQKTMKTDRQGRKEIYAEPDFRAEFKAAVAEGERTPLAGWAERAEISFCPLDHDLDGQQLADVAAAQNKHPIDLALDWSLETDFKIRFRFAIFNRDEDEVAELLQDPNVVIGLSDAGAHASQLCDACFSTHLLGHVVRERGDLTLERAIHMLTQRPAELFGLTDRGLLAEGRPADIVVFDPKTVGASKLRRVHDMPAGADRLVSDASGIEQVIVNGAILGAEGTHRPGHLLRGGHA